jgi:hypothetical protein
MSDFQIWPRPSDDIDPLRPVGDLAPLPHPDDIDPLHPPDDIVLLPHPDDIDPLRPRIFSLGTRLQRMSRVNNPKPLICHTAVVTCRHDGRWEFTAHLENQETEADCSFDLQFDLVGVSRPFGAVLMGQLSAAGTGRVTKIGLRIQGVPPDKTFQTTGHFHGFQDPVYWEEILSASEKFDLIPAWQSYLPTPAG